MIDSHIHLSHRYYEETFTCIYLDDGEYKTAEGSRTSIISVMKERGISCCIEPAIEVDSNEHLLMLSREYEGFIFPAVGNHPTRCVKSTLRDFRRVRDFSKDSRIIAIGETGLDYHHERREQHRLKQKIWFQWQIDLADRLNLPLILHIRQADDDAIRILRRNKKKLHGGVCHCFTRGPETARIYTEEFGFYLGIGGTLLMKEDLCGPLCQTVKSIPLEYLLLETDGPYVKPEKPKSISGKNWDRAINSSLILPAVAQKIADIKCISVDKVLCVTEENTKRLFRLDQSLYQDTEITWKP